MYVYTQLGQLLALLAVLLSSHLTYSSQVNYTLLYINQPSTSFTQGTVLHNFQTTNPVQGSVYRIEFQEGCSSDTFTIGPSNGELSLVRTIDFTTEGTPLKPRCVADDSGSYFITIRTFNCFVTISDSTGVPFVLNGLPAFPTTRLIFPRAFYSGYVVEGVANGTVTILTDDGDLVQVFTAPTHGLLIPSYRVIGQYADDFFVIQKQINCDVFPVILTARSLNRTQQSSFELTLEAYESSLSVTTTVRIDVIDANDHSPQFVNTPLPSLTVRKDVTPGTELTRFQASDLDMGLNGDVRFSIPSVTSPFTVHPLSGSVRVFSSQGLENAQLTVGVTDLGVPPLSTLMNTTIFIDDVNTLPPNINIHSLGPTVSITEHATIGHVVTTVEISDSDSTGVALILSNNSPCNCFQLSSQRSAQNGSQLSDIIVSDVLDFETAPDGHYQVLLTATDNGVPQLSTQYRLQVNIMDENESPSFPKTLYEASVLEGVPSGSHIIRMKAIDPDAGQTEQLTYTLTSSSPSASLFAIHSATGTVHTVGQLDYESINSVEFTVIARDLESLSANTTLIISILDRNDIRPSFTTTSRSITIQETSDANQSIFQFSATDMDSECNGAVEYSIIHQEPLAFRIDSFSGLLYPLSDTSIDFESFQNARLIVHATDLGRYSSYSTETVLNITVTDVNDNVPIIYPINCPCFISEDVSTGISCQPLSAHDVDSTDLRFSIVSGNELGHFRIGTSNGVVSTNSALFYEQQSKYVLGISVSDGTLVSETVNLTVLINDTNNNGPQYSGPISVTIPQDLATGDFAANIGAQQSDAGFNGLTNHTFGSSTASTVTNTFKLDPLSGDLFLELSTSETRYTFTVVARDLADSSMSATASVTITVSGLKNNPPRFIPSTDHRTVSAGLPSNSFISQLSAYDGDTGTNGQLTYRLVDGYGNHSGLFRLNSSGTLISDQSLSSREGSVYVLNISATDSGTSPITAYLELIITVYPSTVMVAGVELVYNPSVDVCHFNGSYLEQLNFEQSLFSIPRTVAGISATYTILDGPFSQAFEVIAPLSELGTRSGFGNTVFINREAVFITLQAQYSGNFHFCSVTVVLEDIDNNPPVFSQSIYIIDVYQNTPIGSSVFKFTVEDNDVGRNTQSRFSRTPTSVPFEINRDTGVLEVDEPLTQDQYRFVVMADDIFLPGPAGTATTMVEVNILLRPNAQPIVVPGSASFNVSETASISDIIATVMIADNDRGSHGDNRLCIASGNIYNYFGFVLNELVVRNRLDYETAPTHFDLVLRAYDSSLNPTFHDITVGIDVIDQNDEAPVFTTTSYTATIPENQSSGTTVLTVRATDRDAGTNGQVTYSIPSVYPFSINPASGLITTTALLDRETFQSYTFNVTATDQGSPVQLTSTAVVSIIVLDENDRSPHFITPTGNTITISEGTEIAPLEAVDDDEGHNSLFVFSIISGNDDFVFTVDPWTGSLSYTRNLNDETASSSYQLRFQVTDLEDSSRSALSPLVMNFVFEDVNNNYPVFDSLVYECTLLEGSTAFTSNCQVRATDSDRTSSVVTYSIVGGNDDLSFSVGSSNGVISVRMLLDADTRPTIYLLVQAEDSGTPVLSARALVIVNINDVNDNLPVFDQQGELRIRIPENLPSNTLLFYVNALDADQSQLNSDISYSITIGDTSFFRLDSSQGAIFLRRGLDYETTRMDSLVILAQDIQQRNDPRVLYNIEVVDINENFLPPVFAAEDNPSAVSVSRNVAPGTDIFTLVASDPDIEQSSVMYYIVDGTGYGYFQVSLTNGTISTMFPLTGVEEDSLSLVVLAMDGGSFPSSSKYTLTMILDSSGTKPFFTSPVLIATPFENTGVGSIFSFVQAEVGGYADSRVCYSIASGNDAGKFAIDNSTGAVLLASGVLDRQLVPTYNLSITASLPGMSEASTMLLIIELLDANNFSPQFPASDYSMSIFENYPVNQSFARIFARDDDLGENGRLVYSLQTSGTLPFAISESTGSFRLTSSLDIDTTSSYSLTVTTRDSGVPMFSRSVSFTVTVIQPATDSAPTPFFTTVSIVVSEGTNPGLVVTTVAPTNVWPNTLMYRFISPEPAEFAIIPNTGEVYLTQSLDYETSVRHTLTILVSDGFQSREISLIMLVTVQDENDNIPMFVSEEFQFSVTEHAQLETEIGVVSATDEDTSAILSYTLVDSQHSSSLSLFAINSQGGNVRVIGDVDREDVPTHVLTVAVGDGVFLNYARIVVRVIDTNDNIPIFPFPLSNVPIPEDTQIGTDIHTMKAFDPDEGLNSLISYTLLTSGVPFQVNSTTGSITTAQSLDFETQKLYTLNIAAFNPNIPSLTTSLQLNVSVLDVLESSPILLNPGSATVLENLPAHSYVSRVTSDSNIRPVYYSIVGGNSRGHFITEPLTGVVRTSVPLNREQVASYQLTVQGAFEVGYESNVTLTVTVLDENDNGPQFSSAYISFLVPEIRTTVMDFNLNVVDPDEGTNAQISSYWVADSFAADYFDFDTSGNLMILQPLDRITIFSSVTFSVYAFDSGSPQLYSQALVNIEVLDSNNNAPQFEQSEYTFVVSAPTPVGLPVFSVSAFDDDEGINAQITYSITGGNGTSKFAIHDEQTGEISIIDNYQLQSVYTLTVTASDGTGSSSVSVIVLVKPCGFQSLLLLPTFTVIEQPENLALQSIILDSQSRTVLTFGQSASLEYSLSLGGPVFDVNPDNGQIFLREQLDREILSTHFIVLQVRDILSSVQRIAQAEIEFIVLDVNDNAPEFDQFPSYVATITNNITQGSEVTRVRATDQDEGINRDVTYSLLSDPSNSFGINSITGVISVVSPLDSAQVGSLVELLVQATDGGIPPLSTNVIVSINIVDSRAPRFIMDVYRVSINESVETGTVVLTVGVIAVAGGSSITYRILETDDLFIPFHLTFQTGVMTVVDPGVDFETRRSYRFNIVANDVSASLTGLAIVEISVLDVNDNTPVFNQSNNLYTIQVNETAAQGSVVLQVNAVDSDSDTQITYQIDVNSQFLSTFDIDQDTGIITTLASLDYEQFPIYQFEVQAVDSGQPPQTGTATVRIVTLNQNDNRPVFAQELYTYLISESASQGANLIFVSATDDDGLQDLTYSIVPGVGSQNFDILSNGLIILSQIADLTEIQYVLNVSAYDGMFQGFTTVRIDVQDSNDHRPEFNQSTYFGMVVEGAAAGQFVTQVFATDMDRGINSEIIYSTSNDMFTVDSVTGVVTTRQGSTGIDRETDPVFRFIVVATDGGDRTGITTVEVTVLDVNDNSPSFTVTEYNVNIIDSLEGGSPVLTVEAEDPDEGNNGTLVYSISHTLGNQFIFTINSMGEISLLVSPDFQSQDMYMFTVGVRDEGTPIPLSASTNAIVTVNILQDVGRAPPEFAQSPYVVSVGEDILPFSDVVSVQLSNASSQNCAIVPFSITFQQVQNLFQIRDTTTGVVSTTAPLSVRNYTLVVQAQCVFSNFIDITINTVTVTIVVRDLNSPPTFEGNPLFFRGSIPENSQNFAEVQVTPIIIAVDNDQGDNATVYYELAALNGAPFDINFRTGRLFINASVDHEREPMYQFSVVAMDRGTPPLSVSKIISVSVEDANDSPPVFEQEVYREEVMEGLTTNMTVFTIRASDNDSSIQNRNITYSLSGNAFRIRTTVDANGNSIGEVQATINLDREVVSSYMLQVIASDGVANDRADISIVITDINDQTPEFNQTIYTVTLAEDFPVGETFVQVFATDNDIGENATVNYTIVEQPDNGEVTINSTTGEISFVTQPDHEISSVFEFQVGAMDIGERQGFTTVAVTLEDVNDNSPVFVQSSFPAEIAENQPAGYDVVRVEATDRDSGSNGVVSYSVDGLGAEYFDIGAMDGFITTRQSFDREMNDSFVITILATDSGTPNRTTSVLVNINITDVNDEKPVFPSSVYMFEVSESAPVQYLITTVKAEDRDIGINADLTYTLSGENHIDLVLDTLSNGSVSLRTRRLLNHERITLYNLTLTAFDRGSPTLQSGTATISISVLDENEHPPVFSEPAYSATPTENIKIGSMITRVEATDRDPTDEVFYSILNAGNYPEFSVNATSGHITVERALDFERTPQYELIIQAADLSDAPLTATVTVRVFVTDINDNPPIFLQHQPTVRITENSIPDPSGIITFTAEDPESDNIDCSNNDRIAYEIVSGNVGNVFELQGLMGVLRILNSLDREEREEYNLVISASDNCDPPFSSTTNLTVIVDDVNDNAPSGGQQVIYLYLLNGIAPRVTLGMVFVNDSDIVNDHSFELVDSSSVFQIENTGVIRIGSTTPELGRYELFVTIRDGDNQQAHTTITAVIQSVTEDILSSSSFSMQFERIDPQRFVDEVYINFLSKVSQTVNRALNITTANLQMFSIQASSDEPGNLDVVLAARNERDGTYFHPNLVQHIIHINRQEIETATHVNILTELVDLCAAESCSENSRCSNAFVYNSVNTNANALGSGSITYLGLTTQHTRRCASTDMSPCEVLSCSEPSYCLDLGNGDALCYEDCSSNPCKNEGFCTPQNPGYHCSCPVGYEGRNCERTIATFIGNSYAIFPTLSVRVEGIISLEIITEREDGLIFYSSRFDSEHSDFIALELVDGLVSLRVSYGGTEMRVIQRDQMLNDQIWHTITVQHNASVSV